jgi:hypothetical protein
MFLCYSHNTSNPSHIVVLLTTDFGCQHFFFSFISVFASDAIYSRTSRLKYCSVLLLITTASWTCFPFSLLKTCVCFCEYMWENTHTCYLNNVLNSAVLISLSQVPVFVQIHELVQHYYVGVCEVKGVRSEFEMVHLKRTPSHCKYLTGNMMSFTYCVFLGLFVSCSGSQVLCLYLLL